MHLCKRVFHGNSSRIQNTKSEMFFCILSTTDDKTIAKGVLQSCQVGLDDKMQKNKSVAMRRNWRRNETLNLMQLGEIAM